MNCQICKGLIKVDELYIPVNKLITMALPTGPAAIRYDVHLNCLRPDIEKLAQKILESKQKFCTHERSGHLREGVPFCDDCEIDLTTVEDE